jgi:hypothetical protein
MGGRTEETDWLRRALAALLDAEAKLADEAPAATSEPANELARLEQLLAADQRLLRDVKAVLRAGLRIFELHGRATAECGAAELLAISRRVVACYTAYLDAAPVVLS